MKIANSRGSTAGHDLWCFDDPSDFSLLMLLAEIAEEPSREKRRQRFLKRPLELPLCVSLDDTSQDLQFHPGSKEYGYDDPDDYLVSTIVFEEVIPEVGENPKITMDKDFVRMISVECLLYTFAVDHGVPSESSSERILQTTLVDLEDLKKIVLHMADQGHFGKRRNKIF